MGQPRRSMHVAVAAHPVGEHTRVKALPEGGQVLDEARLLQIVALEHGVQELERTQEHVLLRSPPAVASVS